jgi:uncharacterized protein YegP (UPF0339 family)
MIELFQSKKNRQFYFRVKGGNNKVIAQSEGYKTKGGRRRGIAALKINLDTSPLEIVDKGAR